jgi:hypothetical protein
MICLSPNLAFGDKRSEFELQSAIGACNIQIAEHVIVVAPVPFEISKSHNRIKLPKSVADTP